MSMSPHDEPATPAVRLFQFANSKLVTLQRINDQMASLMAQRQRVQDELKSVKAQIDELFDREMRQDAPIRRPGEGTTDAMTMRLSAALEPNGEALPPRRPSPDSKLPVTT